MLWFYTCCPILTPDWLMCPDASCDKAPTYTMTVFCFLKTVKYVVVSALHSHKVGFFTETMQTETAHFWKLSPGWIGLNAESKRFFLLTQPLITQPEPVLYPYWFFLLNWFPCWTISATAVSRFDTTSQTCRYFKVTAQIYHSEYGSPRDFKTNKL